ncbi:MAG: DUF4190 domain-containing protein [Gordonia sp. (in: high G+C Gram-positive bacteria)]
MSAPWPPPGPDSWGNPQPGHGQYPVFLGMGQVRDSGGTQSGHGLALAGLITGIAGIVLTIVASILLVAFLSAYVNSV